MATQNSVQFEAAYNAEPKSKLKPHELNGRIRRMYAEVTLAAEVLASGANDIFMAKLPANAVIIGAKLFAPGGTGGTLQLGWDAGESEAADVDGIFPAVAGNAAADIDIQ